MNKLYVAEPKAVNLDIVRKMLPDWTIVEGDAALGGSDQADCTALLIRSQTQVTSSVKAIFPELRSIIRTGVGVDNIDVAFCDRGGIAVYNSPGANADAVSDYVVGMMFYALRNFHQLNRQDAEAWNRFKFLGRSMAGRRIGIIGFGAIGKQVFHKLQGFDCRAFNIYDPVLQEKDLPEGAIFAASVEEVLRQSDVVTLHVPLLPATKYLISKDNLGLLPTGAILINASRGGIVNEADAIEYMRAHDLTYVADTVENEPHVSDALLDAPQAIITPHIASLTVEANDNIVAMAIDNFLQHKPMNRPAAA